MGAVSSNPCNIAAREYNVHKVEIQDRRLVNSNTTITRQEAIEVLNEYSRMKKGITVPTSRFTNNLEERTTGYIPTCILCMCSTGGWIQCMIDLVVLLF